MASRFNSINIPPSAPSASRGSVLPRLTLEQKKKVQKVARGGNHKVSFTVATQDVGRRPKTGVLAIPLPANLRNKPITNISLTGFEGPAITEAVSHNTFLPYQTPITLMDRITVSLEGVATSGGAPQILGAVSMPPTVCPLTAEGSGVHGTRFVCADGGVADFESGAPSRCLVGTNERGVLRPRAVAGSTIAIEASVGSVGVTEGVSLFTTPRPAVDTVFGLFRRVVLASSTHDIHTTIEMGDDGSILTFRSSSSWSSLTFVVTGDVARTALGIPSRVSIPMDRVSAARIQTKVTRLRLPQGSGASNLLAQSITSMTGFVVPATMTNAIAVTNSFGIQVALTWPAGTFTLDTLVSTFNSLSHAAFDAILPGTSSWVRADLVEVGGGTSHVTLRDNCGGGFAVTFLNSSLHQAFGFTVNVLRSSGAAVVGEVALPEGDTQLSCMFNSRSNRILVQPTIQGTVSVDSFSGSATTRAFVSGAWQTVHHTFRVGDAVEVRPHGDTEPFVLQVTEADSSGTIMCAIPTEVTSALAGPCSIQPCLAGDRGVVRWLFGEAALGHPAFHAAPLLGLNPCGTPESHLFHGGALLRRSNPCPPSDLIMVLENGSSVGMRATHFVRSKAGKEKAVLAAITLDRATSHMETRMMEQGVGVSGKVTEIHISIQDAATFASSPLLDATLRLTFTVVIG